MGCLVAQVSNGSTNSRRISKVNKDLASRWCFNDKARIAKQAAQRAARVAKLEAEEEERKFRVRKIAFLALLVRVLIMSFLVACEYAN